MRRAEEGHRQTATAMAPSVATSLSNEAAKDIFFQSGTFVEADKDAGKVEYNHANCA